MNEHNQRADNGRTKGTVEVNGRLKAATPFCVDNARDLHDSSLSFIHGEMIEGI